MTQASPVTRAATRRSRSLDVHLARSRQAAGNAGKLWDAAVIDRLTAGWGTSGASANAALRTSLPTLRARSRQAARNDAYMRRFLRMVERNVVGPTGIRLQSEAIRENGEADQDARRRIEEAWADWGRKGICTMDGGLSWHDVQRLLIRSVARDGEALVRLIVGRDAGNAHGFALQLLEADHLDDHYFHDLGGGRQIFMGVELNEWMRPVAYHLLTRHPGDDTYLRQGRRYVRVPAAEVLHLFEADRIGQARGLPWVHAALFRLDQLQGYEEAELIASRIAASKMGIITTPGGDEYRGDATDADGNLIEEVEPGMITQLPTGSDWKAFDPQHPTTAFEPFQKAMLRGVASGVDVSYVSLANDIEGVNYSSIRQGVLDERDAWRVLQAWETEHLNEPVSAAWLPASMLSGVVRLPMRGLDRFQRRRWQPRGWQWVDPDKDAKANERQVANLWKTNTEVAAEQGRSFEDGVEQIARERALVEQHGLKAATPSDASSDAEQPDEEGSEDAGQDD